MRNGIPVDSLVRGTVGWTERVEQMRITWVSAWGWVAGVNADGGQRIMYPERFEITGPARPEKERTDIPVHLRSHVARTAPA